MIVSETNSVINRTVPLEFQDIPPQMEITGETAREVDLQLRGSSNRLNEISLSDLAAIVSLTGQDTGEKNLSLSAQNVQTPFGIEVLRVNPPRVQFNLEHTVSSLLFVRVIVEGEPLEDYRVMGMNVDPRTVQVVGPESSILPLESLPTTSIRIDGLREDLSTQAELNVMDPLIRFTTPPSPYDVTVQIRETEIESTYTIPLDPSLDTELWSVEPTEIAVTIRGPKSLIEIYDPQILYFTIDTENLSADRQELLPQIVGVNAPVHTTGTEPETVEIIGLSDPGNE